MRSLFIRYGAFLVAGLLTLSLFSIEADAQRHWRASNAYRAVEHVAGADHGAEDDRVAQAGHDGAGEPRVEQAAGDVGGHHLPGAGLRACAL